jgi:hypothetical protein
MLVHKLHGDLVESLSYAISQQEGKPPASRNIPELVAGRDWLFQENNYHVDTSHLSAVVRFSMELTDRPSLQLALELTEYGRRLAPIFQYRGTPPFEDPYVDYAAYFRALMGEQVEAAIAHFRDKAAKADPDQAGTLPAQVLVGLLARLGRYREAADAAHQYLSDADPAELVCPSPIQLCQLAGDPTRLRRRRPAELGHPPVFPLKCLASLLFRRTPVHPEVDNRQDVRIGTKHLK